MTEATKNINAEKIQGNLTVSSVSATTSIVTANFQMTSGATNGYVLTSDALGNARWAASTGGSGGTSTDTYVTGFTYNDANKLTISQNGGQSNLDVFINTMTGLTVNGNVLVNGYISANTIYNVNGSSILYNITASTIYTDYIDFNTNATVPQSEGRVSWDSGTGTLNIAVGDATTGLIDLQVGQEEMVRVFNSEGDTLTKGTIVYVSGNNGNRPSVKRAIATNDGYSVTTLGVVARDITSGAEGYVTTFGIISNLNTLGLTGGTPIWLSPYSAGTYTEIKPQAPQHTVLIGYVVRISATVGSIFVNISNGWELDELHDVRISGVTTGDLLVRGTYNGSNLWVNSKTLQGDYNINGNLVITGTTNTNILTATTIYTNTIGVSGNCVTDAYIGNLYGCSPITIHDSIQNVGSSATGITSFAFGSITQALGNYSHAEGGSTIAVGDYSHAEGDGTSAVGNGSHAEGSSTIATGDWSHAEGEFTQAIGTYSHAEGSSTITTGTYSHAEGDSTQTIGGYSHAEGYLTKSIGPYSHAEGGTTNTGQYFYTVAGGSSGVIALDGTYGDVSGDFTSNGIILEISGNFIWYELDVSNPPYFDGTNTIITLVDTSVSPGPYIGIPGVFQPSSADTLLGGNYSHTEGGSTIAVGVGSHAEGYQTQSIGYYSHAEGRNAQSIGDYSHAEGYQTQSIGTYSHAEGELTTSIGVGSHAEGYDTVATGNHSHAEGNGSTSIGVGSHAEGYDTVATGNYSHAEGSGGKDTGPYGDYSHTEGRSTRADGDYSHAEGFNTFTNNKALYSHAEGVGSQAQEIGSHAEGLNTITTGGYSHSQGVSTLASGDYSFASGSASTASGIASFIHSTNSTVTGDRSVVLGGQGISGTTSDFVYVSNLNINTTPTNNDSNTQILSRNSSTGDIEYTNLSLLTGYTDTFTTGFTYSNNNLTISRNQGQPPLTVTINNFTGLTINGSLSASTYLGLPQTIYSSASSGETVIGTTNNTFSKALFVPANSYTTDDVPEVLVRARRVTGTTGNGAYTTRLYWNTSPSISGSPVLLAVAPSVTNVNNSSFMSRNIAIVDATNLSNVTELLGTYSTDAGTNANGVIARAPSDVVIDWTQDGYLVVAIQFTSSLGSGYCNLIKISK